MSGGDGGWAGVGGWVVGDGSGRAQSPEDISRAEVTARPPRLPRIFSSARRHIKWTCLSPLFAELRVDTAVQGSANSLKISESGPKGLRSQYVS